VFQYLILEVHASHSSLQNGILKLANQNYYVFLKVNKQAEGKICNFTGNRDHINKKLRNKGGSLHPQIF